MDVIKENMFFVVMGVVVLVALVLFMVLVQPRERGNRDKQTDVTNLRASLTGLLEKEDEEGLPNEAAIDAAKKYRKKFDDQLALLVDGLSKMRLSTDLPNLEKGLENEPGAFKTVYQKDITDLKRMVTEKRIDTTQATWNFWDWDEDVPRKAEQRKRATKEYSLIRELIAIITVPELEVMQLDRLEVNPGETRTADYTAQRIGSAAVPRVEPYFDVFPFVLELRMPFHKYEVLIRELLQAKREIPVYVRKVSVMRLEDDPRVYQQIPPLYVGIRVDGWALDYNPEGTKTMPTAAIGFPRGARPPFRGAAARP